MKYLLPLLFWHDTAAQSTSTFKDIKVLGFDGEVKAIVNSRSEYYWIGADTAQLCERVYSFQRPGKGGFQVTSKQILWAMEEFFAKQNIMDERAGGILEMVQDIVTQQFSSQLFADMIMDCPVAIILPLLCLASVWRQPWRITQAFEVARLAQRGYKVHHLDDIIEWADSWNKKLYSKFKMDVLKNSF